MFGSAWSALVNCWSSLGFNIFCVLDLQYPRQLLYGKKDHFEILDHPRHVLHSLSLPAAMPSDMGEGQMVKKGPKLKSSFPTA
ncbi:hypothetical protein OUZ56_032821 [Daphnia magna]|uniref:Uncharacterized protein n=1 Tax=Daphnia magna TaxID=35525 RepID=A0ABQ9ZQ43_9CRUS|nr:hypothetical protein OUZ56_030033 [Daphnia magna]KAK4045283.1 hypothetical protein OUZ56_032821 [Daphnia magna]